MVFVLKMANNSSKAIKLAEYRKMGTKAVTPATKLLGDYFLLMVLSGEIKIKGQSIKPRWFHQHPDLNFLKATTNLLTIFAVK